MVCAAGLYGEHVTIGHGSKGGWDNFGPERLVTRSEGNVLFELDGRPALDLYKEYLGDLATGLPATGLLFPLALRANADDEKSLVRTILAVDEAGQVDDLCRRHARRRTGSTDARELRSTDRRRIGGRGAGRTRRSGDGATLAIAISCVGRRLVLGERAEEEIEATFDALPDGTHQIGFYSYGEISPYAKGRATCTTRR